MKTPIAHWKRTTPYRFLAAGGGCAILYFSVNYALSAIAGLSQIGAAAAAYALSFCTAYALQKTWVFRSAAAHATTLPRYAVVQIIALAVTAILSQAISGAAHALPASVVSLISTLIAGACSFALSFFWAFRDVPSKSK